MTLLGYERGEAAATDPILFRGELDRLLALANERGVDQDPVIRQTAGLVLHQGRDHALPRHAHAHAVPRRPPAGPGRRRSRSCTGASTTRSSTELGVDILGADALVPTGRRPSSAFRTDDAGAPNSSASWVDTFLNARAGTIYAGTSQVQRNILGEMVLGLPKEPTARRDRMTDSESWRIRDRAGGVSPAHPRLWPVAVRQWRRTTPTGGGGGGRSCRCRRGSTCAFRLLTQYGDSEARASAADVVNYLAWCRRPAVRRRP